MNLYIWGKVKESSSEREPKLMGGARSKRRVLFAEARGTLHLHSIKDKHWQTFSRADQIKNTLGFASRP